MHDIDDIRGAMFRRLTGASTIDELAAMLAREQERVAAERTKTYAARAICPGNHRGLSIFTTEGWEGTLQATALFALRDVFDDDGDPTSVPVTVVTPNEGDEAVSYRYLYSEGRVDGDGLVSDDTLTFVDGETVSWGDVVAVHF